MLVCVLPAAKHGLTLEDVRQLVERHHSIELPGFSPYSAVQELVSRHQVAWAAAAADCVAAAHRQLLHLVMLHVARTCSRFPAAAEHIRWAPWWLWVCIKGPCPFVKGCLQTLSTQTCCPVHA